MPRNFKLGMPKAASLADPKVLVRVGLGILLLANLIAAAFAFHITGDSPEALDQQLTSAIAQRQAEQLKLTRTRKLNGSVEQGKQQGDTFLASYVSSRRHTYSSVLGEIHELARSAGMKDGPATIAPLEAIEGSDDLDTMTLSVDFEGGYNELKKFVNLLDRSPRFLMLESLTVTPRPKGDLLAVTIKLNTFVREEKGGDF